MEKLANLFPTYQPATLTDALTIFSDNLPDIRKALYENAQYINRTLQPYQRMEDGDEMTVKSIKLHVRFLEAERRVGPLLKTIKRIDTTRQPLQKNSITGEHIARAKEVPITDLYDGKLIKNTGLCPFHEEATGSFHINRKRNTWRCFGCQLYGDAIDYVMHRDKVDFIRAVKKLI